MMTDMGCGCAVSDSYEWVEDYWDKEVKARKEHECSECGEIINKKEIYKKITVLFEGTFETYKVCRPCQLIAQDLFCGGSYGLGELREEFKRHYGFDYMETGANDPEPDGD